MGKLNWGRIVVGGTLAGILLIAFLAIYGALFSRLNGIHRPIPTLYASAGIAGVIFCLGAFLILGIVMIWWYAAIRPLFGPGPQTAAIAAVAVWVTAIWFGVVGFGLKSLAMGEPYSLPAGPTLPILCLLIMIASTVAGASVYKERQV
jgi:hypothetical protein